MLIPSSQLGHFSPQHLDNKPPVPSSPPRNPLRIHLRIARQRISVHFWSNKGYQVHQQLLMSNIQQLLSLELTLRHLKMDDWKTIVNLLGQVRPSFMGKKSSFQGGSADPNPMKRGWISSSCHSSVYVRAALMRLPQTNLYTITNLCTPNVSKSKRFFIDIFFWGEKKTVLGRALCFPSFYYPLDQENDWKDRWFWCIMYHFGWLYSSQKWISSNIEPSTTKQLQSLIEQWWWIYLPSLRVGQTVILVKI